MLMRFDPFRELDRQFDRLSQRNWAAGVMPIDAYRRGDHFYVHFDLPGADADSVDLEVEKNVLTVKAERSWEPQEGDEVVVAERPRGTFTRQLFLGETLDTDHIEASYDKGVLTVSIPRAEDPFHIPQLREFRSAIDVLEFAIMCTAGFPEPRTFSRRVRKVLNARRQDFDVVHDNQCLGNGILGLLRDGWPIVETLHHPITVDRRLELAQNPWTKRPLRQITLRRWFGFLRMQCRVARQMPRIVTVSESSRRDITRDMGVPYERMAIVPVGVDTDHFRPLPQLKRVPGRIMTTASADVALKGLVPLLEAVAKVRTERDAELVVVGKQRDGSSIPSVIERLGLEGHVTFLSGVAPDRMVELYNEAEVAVVPSLYEGFSLPAIEAMACGTPLVATTGGALPEVVGSDGVNALTVLPGDPDPLAGAIGRVLDDPTLRTRLGATGRAHVLDRFTWAE